MEGQVHYYSQMLWFETIIILRIKILERWDRWCFKIFGGSDFNGLYSVPFENVSGSRQSFCLIEAVQIWNLLNK